MIASAHPSKQRSSTLDCIWQGHAPYPPPFALLFEVEKHIGVDWCEHRQQLRVLSDSATEAWSKGTFAALLVINRIRLTGHPGSRWNP